MGRKQSRPMATGYALLLLVGLFYLTISLPIPPHDYQGSIQPAYQTSHYAVLSEEQPVFRYNISREMQWIEVLEFSTNSTPVSLNILDGSGTLLNVTNVTSISGFSLTVARTDYSFFWLEVVRLHSDAMVNITMRNWMFFLPPSFDAIGISYTPTIIFITLVSFISLYKLGKIAQEETHRKAAIIILFLIIGAALILPLLQGMKGQYFTPTYEIQTSHDNYVLSLNESRSSFSSTLTELSPVETSWVSLKACNFSATAYPFLIRVTTDFEHEIVFENIDNNHLWWLKFTESTSQSSTLTFERIDSDVELQFAIETEYRLLVQGTNPLLPAVLAVIGASFSILAIGIAVRIDWAQY